MLAVRKVQKRFGTKVALADVSFPVATGEIVALLGPSGSGKSTLLSIVAGLESPDSGQVLWEGKDLTTTPPHLRGFGLMFQDYALFPHRDVAGNIAFGLQMAGKPNTHIAARLREVLELVGLSGFEHRDISTLSGGEQQRVALARALAPQPRLLMLDEPLGSLDRALRTRLLQDLAGILRSSGQTSLYVTHDQEEAFAIADRIVLLEAGRLVQDASPPELYLRPASAFVAGFLGLQNLFPARAAAGKLHTPIGEFALPAAQGEYTALLRPERIRVGEEGPAKVEGKLIKTEFQGATTLVYVQVGAQPLKFSVPSTETLPNPGEQMTLSFDPKSAFQLFPANDADKDR
jgi:ABC-type Fe3+/spermidine/putrescine transport system ATPase subunit